MRFTDFEIPASLYEPSDKQRSLIVGEGIWVFTITFCMKSLVRAFPWHLLKMFQLVHAFYEWQHTVFNNACEFTHPAYS